MQVRYIPIQKQQADYLRNGGLDANGKKPEIEISNGNLNPCRCCLKNIEKGKPMLVLSHRPFSGPQPFAETGPIFICAEECSEYAAKDEIPSVLLDNPTYLIRGYKTNERIAYGTGKVVIKEDLETELKQLLEKDQIAFAHVRSASNNCFQCKAERV